MYRIITIFLMLSIALPILVVFLILENQAAVIEVHPFNSDDAVVTQNFVKKTIQDLLNKSDQPFSLSATEDDLNGLFAFGHRSIPAITGKTVISPETFETTATIKIPQNPIGDYLNFRLKIAPSDSGLYIQSAAIGKLPFSDTLSKFLVGLLLNMAFGFNEGSDLLNAIDGVSLSDRKIDVHLKAIPKMDELLEQLRGRLRFLRDEISMMGDPEKVRTYYLKVIEISEQLEAGEPLSLAYYMNALFKTAQDRGGDPVLENKAAILALGIYFGSWRVEQMIGKVRTEEMKRGRKRTELVGLAGRSDLRRHFIISAALEIASKQGISHAIGEFKELFDAREGGSGFSFVDLAADRAGVRFAETATARESAQKIQDLLADHADEALFFPSIKDLPEGLSKETFGRYFGTIESERYIKLVNEVDLCLSQLPAYKDSKAMSVSIGCHVVSVVPAELL